MTDTTTQLLVGSVVGLAALYAVVRLAVRHAISDSFSTVRAAVSAAIRDQDGDR